MPICQMTGGNAINKIFLSWYIYHKNTHKIQEILSVSLMELTKVDELCIFLKMNKIECSAVIKFFVQKV